MFIIVVLTLPFTPLAARHSNTIFLLCAPLRQDNKGYDRHRIACMPRVRPAPIPAASAPTPPSSADVPPSPGSALSSPRHAPSMPQHPTCSTMPAPPTAMPVPKPLHRPFCEACFTAAAVRGAWRAGALRRFTPSVILYRRAERRRKVRVLVSLLSMLITGLQFDSLGSLHHTTVFCADDTCVAPQPDLCILLVPIYFLWSVLCHLQTVAAACDVSD